VLHTMFLNCSKLCNSVESSVSIGSAVNNSDDYSNVLGALVRRWTGRMSLAAWP
jgi:hypothetical protein